MKKAQQLLIILLFMTTYSDLNLIGQVVNENINATFKPTIFQSSKLKKIIGSDDTGFYITRSNSTGISKTPTTILEHYNKDLELTNFSVFDLDQFDEVVDFIIYRNILYLAYCEGASRSGIKNLIIESIDKQTLELTGAKTIIKVASNSKEFSKGQLKLSISEKKRNLLVLSNVKSNDTDDMLMIMVLDEYLKISWRKTMEMPLKGEKFQITKSLIDQHGRVYVVVSQIEKDEKTKKKNTKYTLMRVDPSSSFSYPINLTDQKIKSLDISINDNQDVFCGGFHFEDTPKQITGCFYLKINGISGDVLAESRTDISSIEFESKKLVKTGRVVSADEKASISNLGLQDVVTTDDGGLVLVGEINYVSSYSSTTMSNHKTTTTKYVSEEIIVIKLSEEGAIDWHKIIEKKQINHDKEIISFTLLKEKDSFFLLFSDNPKNIGLKGKKIKRAFGEKTLAVRAMKFDSSGILSEHVIFQVFKKRFTLKPFKIREKINGHFLICGSSRWTGASRLTFAKLDLSKL